MATAPKASKVKEYSYLWEGKDKAASGSKARCAHPARPTYPLSCAVRASMSLR